MTFNCIVCRTIKYKKPITDGIIAGFLVGYEKVRNIQLQLSFWIDNHTHSI